MIKEIFSDGIFRYLIKYVTSVLKRAIILITRSLGEDVGGEFIFSWFSRSPSGGY